ncbi:hypothetical protein FACS189494_00680 [Spirochaetia bacterium]|nr:hypothetical protein FACS189494_00680 [Spirochaetia bacterium]
MNIDVLEKALLSLKEALSVFAADNTNTIVRDSVIQRYEYTFELVNKILRRFLMQMETDRQTVSEMFFTEIIRLCNKRGLLLNDIEKWNVYRKMRNLTSHTYDEFNADEAVLIIPDFITEVEFAINKMKEHLNNEPDSN